MSKTLMRYSPLLLLAACADIGAPPITPGPGLPGGLLVASATAVLESAVPLVFPLVQDDGQRGDAYAWPINAVFDHSMSERFCADGIVIAFTGEAGQFNPSGALARRDPRYFAERAARFRPRSSPCPADVLQGFQSDPLQPTPFNVTGSYTGGCDACDTYLYYDGHPGYDYHTVSAAYPDGHRPVFAAASGTVESAGGDPFNTVTIAHANGFRTIYVHLKQVLVSAGDSVTTDTQIGVSGFAGLSGPTKVHLHFQVTKNGLPFDPYGWTGIGPDPYTSATGIVNRRLWPTSVIILAGRFLRGLAYGNGALYALHSQVGGDGDVIRISRLDAFTGDVLQESPEFNWNGRGVTIGADTLWVADARADVIHRVDPSSLVPINSFGTPGTEPNGLAFDGSNLWLTDPFFQRTYELSFSGVVGSGTFAIPNAFRTGLEWEEPGMWMTTAETELTHYLPGGATTGTRTLQGLPPGTFVYDIALGNGKVYISAGDRIYIQDW